MQNWCIKNGIPYDVVHCLEDFELLGHAIIFSQFEGAGEFDWDRMEFKPKR